MNNSKFDFILRFTSDFFHFSPTNLQQYAVLDIDHSGDGKIEYNEFVVWWQKDERFKELQLDDNDLFLRAEAYALFREYDKDGSGSIGQ
jgi:Ca2+-binding EF-hand superfamily protein